ncbi:uncharacterized protein PAC_17742 [Phialocephala subalpina]|uniref:DUF6590 domain-containing protein n=1 Tax=Phialocephala subalpina TaxID=576137 RepID=A0A1L7XS19_9HELO|nr:uncharacterized protein PAC_17742 [Phialocephala subalpina]
MDGNWRLRRGNAYNQRTIPGAHVVPAPRPPQIVGEEGFRPVPPGRRPVVLPQPPLGLGDAPIPPPVPYTAPRGFDTRRRPPPSPYRAFGTRHGREELREALKPGTVIYATMHNEDFVKPEDIMSPDRHQSLSYIGGWVYSKKRKFIVIKQYTRHFIALPIYTNGGQGLAAHQDELDDWIGVRDSTAENPPASESNHANVIYTMLEAHRHRPEPWFHMLNKSHAKLTHPASFRSDVECEIEGHIADEKDVARLIKLFYKDAPKEEVVVAAPTGAANKDTFKGGGEGEVGENGARSTGGNAAAEGTNSAESAGGDHS